MSTMSCSVGYVDPRTLAKETPKDHNFFRPERLLLSHSLLESLGLLGDSTVSFDPPLSEDRDLLLFHEGAYVDLVRNASSLGLVYLDNGDTPVFEGVYENNSKRVGGAVKLVSMVHKGEVDHGFHMGGGLHHAYPDHASGFCVFNDVGICVSKLKEDMGVKRVAYVDIDAHHGDGVHYSFYEDPGVLNIDIHEDGRYLFPGTGYPDEIGDGAARGVKVNVPLLPGSSDRSFLYAFNELVPPLIRSFAPEFILFQCGGDSHRGDALTGLSLTTRSYHVASSTLHDLAHEVSGGKIVAFGGGGYNIPNVARCWAVMFSNLLGVELDNALPRRWVEEVKRKLGVDPGLSVFDPEGADAEDASAYRHVKAVVENLKRKVFPILGVDND